jgi:type I restriction-modification system DNA methylase subunit
MLLEDFANPKLDLRPSRIGNLDVIGNAYEYLIAKFAAGAGKKAGEFYTPGEVSELMAELVALFLYRRFQNSVGLRRCLGFGMSRSICWRG